jgi:hypothetical protein
MREHPVIGERILRAIPGMGSVARIVRHEHERFDGSSRRSWVISGVVTARRASRRQGAGARGRSTASSSGRGPSRREQHHRGKGVPASGDGSPGRAGSARFACVSQQVASPAGGGVRHRRSLCPSMSHTPLRPPERCYERRAMCTQARTPVEKRGRADHRLLPPLDDAVRRHAAPQTEVTRRRDYIAARTRRSRSATSRACRRRPPTATAPGPTRMAPWPA